jgi:hypothetical protein
MACVGIVGGLGVGATVHYYEKIAAACKARGVVPDLVIVHADVDRGQGFVRAAISTASRLSRTSSGGWRAGRRVIPPSPHLHRAALTAPASR